MTNDPPWLLPTELTRNNYAHVILTAEADKTDADKTDADNRNGHAAVFEIKLGERTSRAAEASRERSAEQFLNNLESVALAVEGNLGTYEDRFELTASGINDTEKKQLATRSGLPRLRCCACHLHRKWAMNSHKCARTLLNRVSTSVSLQG